MPPTSLVLKFLVVPCIVLALVGGAAHQAQPPAGKAGRGLIAQANAFQTDVPAHPVDIILVRPTSTSIGVSIVTATDTEGYIEFGPQTEPQSQRTPPQMLKAKTPALIELTGLKPDTAYAYAWRSRTPGSTGAFADSTPGVFHTPRSPGASFTFTIQADSHLDSNMSPPAYLRTLANALADKPDFHVDLGDTFMTDKRREFRDALPQYDAQRYYFGQLCSSAPLFMVLGNHDGEAGYAGPGSDQISGWSFDQRTSRFPPPLIEAPGGMYSGRTTRSSGTTANYYAFEWGDALVVVLDPFSPTTTKPRGGQEMETTLTDQSWALTLGREQYDWLDRTLAASKARYKFVFIHHLVGGIGKASRGGVEAAPYFEWGGKNADGSPGFAAHRPGWTKPIHQLLVDRGVSAVFHGHDHLYVHSELDGVTYQCVPQPGNPRGGTRSAAEYGYKSGTIFGSPGHLRVTVAPMGATVSFVRSSLSDAAQQRRGDDGPNGSVVAEYTIKPGAGK